MLWVPALLRFTLIWTKSSRQYATWRRHPEANGGQERQSVRAWSVERWSDAPTLYDPRLPARLGICFRRFIEWLLPA